MSRDRVERLVREAIAHGVLPVDARAPAGSQRPWPVVLLTALGAWLAALPLLGAVALLLGDLLQAGAGPYVVGALALGAAVVVLRSRGVPLFVEQLATPALLVGVGAIGFGVFRDLAAPAGAAVLALGVLGLGAALPPPWLRVLAGAAAAALLALAVLPERWGEEARLLRLGLAWHVDLGAWLLALAVQRRWLADGARARAASALEAMAAGWLLATLAGLAAWSGMTLLVGATLGSGFAGGVTAPAAAQAPLRLLQALSLLLALAAAGVAARRWPSLRSPWHAGVAAVPVGLAGFMPALGAVLLALAACATTARPRLAAAAALGAAWIVGAFYYQLQWPLATKAVVLIGAGALLGALAWVASRAPQARAAAAPRTAGAPAGHAARAGIAATALLVLGVVDVGIWRNERLIAAGRPVYLELAPVDPRALVQGDYMRLGFRVPDDVRARGGLLGATRPRVVARRDARGVATLLRADDGTPLAADELRIELTPKDGRWTVVTDAWFFREGEAARWAAARYGEFRVEPGGRALLVGLRGAGLEPL